MAENMDPTFPSGGKIAILCEANRFGEFITGLLGKAQTIERQIVGEFLVNRDELLGLHHLIEQRIHDQNEATLIQFVASVGYDDGLSVDIGSIEEFKNYAEVRALHTQYISLLWVYLITFKGKSTPERQQIEISFKRRWEPDIGAPFEHRYRAARYDSDSNFPKDSGYISIKINHTMRSWGMDLESLLNDHIRIFIKDRRDTIPRLMSRSYRSIGFITFFAVASVILIGGLQLLKLATNAYQISAISPKNTEMEVLILINAKLDILYSFIWGGRSATLIIGSIVYLFFGAVISAVVAGLISDSANQRFPSFILFTQNDVILRNDKILMFRRNWRIAAIGFIISIISGVGGNIVTYYVW